MRKIKLTQGMSTMVDDKDYEYLNQFKWYVWKNRGRCYAVRNTVGLNGFRSSIKMHRLIMGATNPKIQIDHKDHNGLNNQRYNLRTCNTSQNVSNQGKSFKRGSTSKYKGVNSKTYYTGVRRWVAQISVNYKKIHLGCFKKEKEAALSYNAAALKYQGQYAHLNKI